MSVNNLFVKINFETKNVDRYQGKELIQRVQYEGEGDQDLADNIEDFRVYGIGSDQ